MRAPLTPRTATWALLAFLLIMLWAPLSERVNAQGEPDDGPQSTDNFGYGTNGTTGLLGFFGPENLPGILGGYLGAFFVSNNADFHWEYAAVGAAATLLIIGILYAIKRDDVQNMFDAWNNVFTPLMHVLVLLVFLAVWFLFGLGGGLALGLLVGMGAQKHAKGQFLAEANQPAYEPPQQGGDPPQY